MARLSIDQLDPRNNLELYTREALRNADVWTDKLIREEYSRLRDIAQKRLKRLAASEPTSYAYTKNVGVYGPARGQSTEELRKLLPDLAKFIAAKTGTVSGIRAARRQAIRTLQEHGYTGITPSNYASFGEFMREWRARKLEKVIGSQTVVELFEFTEDNDIPWDTVKQDFERWLVQKDKLEEWVYSREERGKDTSSADLVKRFDTWEEQRQRKNAKARERRAAKKQKRS